MRTIQHFIGHVGSKTRRVSFNSMMPPRFIEFALCRDADGAWHAYVADSHGTTQLRLMPDEDGARAYLNAEWVRMRCWRTTK